MGGTPSKIRTGYPPLRLDGGITHPGWMGYPQSRTGGGDTPSQVWMGGYPIPGPDRGVPHLRSRWEVPHPADGGTPIQDQDGVPPPCRVWMEYPPPPHATIRSQIKHGEHLLRGGRRASCVQAGGLS